MAEPRTQHHTTWCSTNRWSGRNSDPLCNCQGQELFEAVHAEDDEAHVLAFLRRAAVSSSSTECFGGEDAILILTLTAKVSNDELAAIRRLLRG